MVLAYHVIFGAYGFWLPNDPRGSWSDFLASWELFLAGGKATKTTTRRSVAGAAHDRSLRKKTKSSLKYPAVVFNGKQAKSIGDGFAEMVAKSDYQVYACTILPEHVHLVLGRYRYSVETMVRLLKAQASNRLTRDELHPLAAFASADASSPTPWAEGCWKAFLNDIESILRAIRYVEDNPLKEGKRRQKWAFVRPYPDQSASGLAGCE